MHNALSGPIFLCKASTVGCFSYMVMYDFTYGLNLLEYDSLCVVQTKYKFFCQFALKNNSGTQELEVFGVFLTLSQVKYSCGCFIYSTRCLHKCSMALNLTLGCKKQITINHPRLPKCAWHINTEKCNTDFSFLTFFQIK